MAAFKDHFSELAAGYAAHRPTYPRALADYLAGIAPARRLAWDCGCGSGQLSALLAEAFERVVATDASAEQIGSAAPAERVEYRVAPAEASGLPDASVDLVTVAQAAHWFDLPAFYAEARRVARPGAAIALVTYGIMEVDAEIDAVTMPFYYEALKGYWPPERAHVENGYRALEFPFEELAPPKLAIRVDWRLADLTGYVETWSAVRALKKARGEEPVLTLFEALARVWGPPERVRAVRWPLALRVGRLA
ncbi:MAG TPA: class I SAM-dependent methyltransferase [Alphaproteobacteria bacterium]|nr:class I SAM-dependent methyltransferase [Alphaproteobacteria bacterium]